MTAFLWTMAVLFGLRLAVLLTLAHVGKVSEPWTSGQLLWARAQTIALFVWAVVLLSACGGVAP